MNNGISIGNKIELEKIETKLSADETKRQVYVSQVMDETEDGGILAAMPIQEGKLIPLGVGEEFYAVFYTKSNLLKCRAQVVGRYKKGSLFLMELALKTELKKVQRREYFRFECRIPIEYRVLSEQERVFVEEGKEYEENVDEQNWKKGIMLDLSGGGMRFVSAEQEEKASLIQIRFEMNVEQQPEMVYIISTLLRCENNPNNRSLYDNRIEFWRIDKALREKIIQFIFAEQRKRRSKELGLE